MDIYVVQRDDTIQLIADRFGVSVQSIIQYNELTNPYNLVVGQTIVIVYPKEVYTVKVGDTLAGIAKYYGISIMQLLRNNPFISDREFIYPGETLIISYNKTDRNIETNGYAFQFIQMETLVKTLPFLTYLSIYNYQVIEGGNIKSYYDDTEVIQTAKTYGTLPLLMTTILSPQGEASIEVAFNILINEDTQDILINNLITILKQKEFYGINMIFSYISSESIKLYNNFVVKAARRVREQGFTLFVTINPKRTGKFENLDYSVIGQAADGIAFIHFLYGKNMDPPGPVSSYSYLDKLMESMKNIINPNKIRIGIPCVGYDWELPYVENKTVAKAVALREAVELAQQNNSIIQFDEESQTPFFQYQEKQIDTVIEHIVWFTDARSINSLLELILKYGLSGKDIWNIMVFYAQMWLVINSQYNIVKLIPDKLETL